ncbi:MAG: hypothetical protein JNL18_06990 [Planctomycetaceae bacterium]|nr:hypothetical protein [Planctomycetaceae bacterium]
MKVDHIQLRRCGVPVLSAAGLFVVALALTTGCGEKAVEKAPENFKEAREKHFEMMRQESGQGGPAAGQK